MCFFILIFDCLFQFSKIFDFPFLICYHIQIVLFRGYDNLNSCDTVCIFLLSLFSNEILLRCNQRFLSVSDFLCNCFLKLFDSIINLLEVFLLNLWIFVFEIFVILDNIFNFLTIVIFSWIIGSFQVNIILLRSIIHTFLHVNHIVFLFENLFNFVIVYCDDGLFFLKHFICCLKDFLQLSNKDRVASALSIG